MCMCACAFGFMCVGFYVYMCLFNACAFLFVLYVSLFYGCVDFIRACVVYLFIWQWTLILMVYSLFSLY